MSRPDNRENLMSLADQLLWGMETYGVSTELFGYTAYVGFNSTLDPKDAYFYCDGTADDVQINAALAYVNGLGGGCVFLEQGTFTLADSIIFPGDNLKLHGCGAGTLLDGDGLATTEHAIIISGNAHCAVVNLVIQTLGGGGNTIHCIFIEDGSDDFHIEHVSIEDSDDNGVHIEGTAIVLGHIHGCHITATDGHGIYVNMDGGETISFLHIEDNDIDNTGASGIRFDPSTGNESCVINGNIIADIVADAIAVNDFNEGKITNNICAATGASGITLETNSDDNTITENILNTNGTYGIEIEAANCDNNRVRDNHFHSPVTAPVLNTGTGTIFHTKQYYVARDDDNLGNVPGKSITNGQSAYVAVHFPEGMQQLMALNLYVIPDATQGAADWDLDSDYGAIGEAYNTHAEAEAAATYNVTQNQWFRINVFTAGLFVSAVAEDTGGFSLTVGTAGHNVTVVMTELYYV